MFLFANTSRNKCNQLIWFWLQNRPTFILTGEFVSAIIKMIQCHFLGSKGHSEGRICEKNTKYKRKQVYYLSLLWFWLDITFMVGLPVFFWWFKVIFKVKMAIWKSILRKYVSLANTSRNKCRSTSFWCNLDWRIGLSLFHYDWRSTARSNGLLFVNITPFWWS